MAKRKTKESGDGNRVPKLADFIPCATKTLSDDLLLSAAATAIAQNPVNRPPEAAAAAVSFDVQRIAVMTTKYWGSKGVKLGVYFMDASTTAALRAKILSHMNAWGKWANVSFTESASRSAEVRISRGAGGYYSYLGTDVLHIGSGQQTMNLEAFSERTPDSEFFRVVRHETGHTLGCPHEHMRREIVARLDPQKTIDYFGRTQGWSASEVRQQVLTPVEESALMATPHAEDDSIMAYQLPASITVDGRPIVGGVDITTSDGAFIGKVYPLAIQPPTPPPPPPPGPPPKPPGPGAAKVSALVTVGADTYSGTLTKV